MAVQNVVITGTGSYIPTQVVDENFFAEHEFYTMEKQRVEQTGVEAARKLETITGIKERRYASHELNNSDLATKAAEAAIADAGIDKETIDSIIVAQNFGDVSPDSPQIDQLPSIASRVKHKLQIDNPNCVAYDIIFGCPGWVQGVIQAYSYMKAGMAKTCLVIGADTLSRITDPHDRDSMIYADGAGATIVQLLEEEEPRGILSVAAQSFTKDEAYFLFFGTTFNPTSDDKNMYIKMHGRKIYEFALTHVPKAMKSTMDKANVPIDSLKKIFIHQANAKMDEAILKRFYRQFKTDIPDGIMPMSIGSLGNSSVATIPTLYNAVKKGKVANHTLNPQDIILFASVGAGMNINAIASKE